MPANTRSHTGTYTVKWFVHLYYQAGIIRVEDVGVKKNLQEKLKKTQFGEPSDEQRQMIKQLSHVFALPKDAPAMQLLNALPQ